LSGRWHKSLFYPFNRKLQLARDGKIFQAAFPPLTIPGMPNRSMSIPNRSAGQKLFLVRAHLLDHRLLAGRLVSSLPATLGWRVTCFG
jgi:hypothetical protein